MKNKLSGIGAELQKRSVQWYINERANWHIKIYLAGPFWKDFRISDSINIEKMIKNDFIGYKDGRSSLFPLRNDNSKLLLNKFWVWFLCKESNFWVPKWNIPSLHQFASLPTEVELSRISTHALGCRRRNFRRRKLGKHW